MGARILVRENNHESREIGGLHVILREKDKLSSGEVLSVGKHPKVDALGLQLGDTVWFRRECGVEAGEVGMVFLLTEQLEAEGEADVVSLGRPR